MSKAIMYPGSLNVMQQLADCGVKELSRADEAHIYEKPSCDCIITMFRPSILTGLISKYSQVHKCDIMVTLQCQGQKQQ